MDAGNLTIEDADSAAIRGASSVTEASADETNVAGFAGTGDADSTAAVDPAATAETFMAVIDSKAVAVRTAAEDRTVKVAVKVVVKVTVEGTGKVFG